MRSKLENVAEVIVKVSNYMSEIVSQEPKWLEATWAAINTEIELASCQAYSYIPDMEGDPFSENSVWSFNYFFVDNETRKIVYFTCIATAGKRGHLGGRTHHSNGHGSADEGDSDYPSNDDASYVSGSPRSMSPSMSPYGTYGSPRGFDDAEDEDESGVLGVHGTQYSRQGVTIQVADDSDSSCDEMS